MKNAILVLPILIGSMSGCKSTFQSATIVEVFPCHILQRDLTQPVTPGTKYKCAKQSGDFSNVRSPLLGSDGKLYSVEGLDVKANQ